MRIRRFGLLLLIVVTLSGGLSVFSSSNAQDHIAANASPVTSPVTPDRTEALEARVAALETQIAELWILLTPTAEPLVEAEEEPLHTVSLELLLYGTGNYTIRSGACTGEGGFDDIRVGAAITVMDGDGSIIATGWIETAERSSGGCLFTGTIEDVPEVPFYQFKVSHRGAPSYSLAEMKSRDWTVELSIGR